MNNKPIILLSLRLHRIVNVGIKRTPLLSLPVFLDWFSSNGSMFVGCQYSALSGALTLVLVWLPVNCRSLKFNHTKI